MGLIGSVFGQLFGGRGNVLKETVEVFRENAEGRAERESEYSRAALTQFAAEFAHQRRGGFDRFIDAVNRVPRPALALGTLLLFASAMYDPVWFAERMQGLAVVPEPMWWLLGAIVSFYFGARHQLKSQEFNRSLAESVLRATHVADNVSKLRTLRLDADTSARTEIDAEITLDVIQPTENAALDEWRRGGA